MKALDVKRAVLERNLSLIGYGGLSHIKLMLENVKHNKLTGDFVETGAWKGGACMYARALMNEMEMPGKVIVCDSFQGVPKPDVAKYPLDKDDFHYKDVELAVPLEEVKGHFKEFGLMEGTEFVPGWFKDTMPIVKDMTDKISVLRLDGDLYQSTTEVLEALYDKVEVGGFIVIDDYCLDRCIWAVQDFAKKRQLKEELLLVRYTSIGFWQKGI